MPNSILIVEDDTDIQKYLQTVLVEKGYLVHTANTGIAALNTLEKLTPDIVILDIKLPDITGESICLKIKKTHPQVLVIFLTGLVTTSQIIHGLDIGADEYITKPFVMEELLSRIRARLRQTSKDIQTVIQIADIVLNTKTCRVTRAGKRIPLTPKEFKLLEYFMRNSNQVITREQILNAIWQYHYAVESRVVDIYVGTLRKKIDNDANKKIIHSVRAFGYMLEA